MNEANKWWYFLFYFFFFFPLSLLFLILIIYKTKSIESLWIMDAYNLIDYNQDTNLFQNIFYEQDNSFYRD
jgi:hypothetical protein